MYNDLLVLQFWNPGTYIRKRAVSGGATGVRPFYGAHQGWRRLLIY